MRLIDRMKRFSELSDEMFLLLTSIMRWIGSLDFPGAEEDLEKYRTVLKLLSELDRANSKYQSIAQEMELRSTSDAKPILRSHSVAHQSDRSSNEIIGGIGGISGNGRVDTPQRNEEKSPPPSGNGRAGANHTVPDGAGAVDPTYNAAPASSVLCRSCGNPIPEKAMFCPYCGSKKVVEGPCPTMSKVEFSAIAPKVMTKGDYTMIDIIMYDEDHRGVVDEQIKTSDDPVQEARSGVYKAAEGAEVRIVLSSPDVEIEDNTETGIWQGGHLDFSFAVFLPTEYKKRQIFFTAAVYINDVIATKLKFIVKTLSFLNRKIAVTREDVLSAFVSYASQDRKRVAAIVQGMKKARPDMDVFFDIDSLRSGEDWEAALQREIEERDVLFLCWSHFARDSKWVDAEWRYALRQKGADCIEPVPIEPPDQCPPPRELLHKHFNDKLLYIIDSKS